MATNSSRTAHKEQRFQIEQQLTSYADRGLGLTALLALIAAGRIRSLRE
ncbi:MAG: hypothetical protein R6V85_03770 [Polyangia bacterium]